MRRSAAPQSFSVIPTGGWQGSPLSGSPLQPGPPPDAGQIDRRSLDQGHGVFLV